MIKRASLLAAAALAFAIAATANSGGYRYGTSDQAFYIPAIAIGMEPSLFPRDHIVFERQSGLWLGDEIAGLFGSSAPEDFAIPFAALYGLTLVLIFAATVSMARGLGGDWWAVAAALALVALRHRIARTGANSLEGYMHPRMLAFGVGLLALPAVLRQRFLTATLLAVTAVVVHPTTGLWFCVVVAAARVVSLRVAPKGLALTVTLSALAFLIVVRFAISRGMTTMDGIWVSVIADRDYLFPAEWPLYAWGLNLAYPAILLVILLRRRALGLARPQETALVSGLIALLAVFLVAVPLTMARLAIAVQLQVNRVFWLLDAAVAIYGSVWLTRELGSTFGKQAKAVAALGLVVIAAGRGYYLVRVESPTPLVTVGLAPTAWRDALEWLRAQPSSWHVLVDPNHAWKYGASVRLGAFKDVPLDASKDAAMAIYDRDLAVRVTAYGRALEDFDRMTAANVVRLARRYSFDVFLDTASRSFDFPVLYRNDRFVVYDLR